MPKITPSTEAVRKVYRASLLPTQRGTFAELANMIDHPESSLRWYYNLGRLVRNLRASSRSESKATAWLQALSDALGPGVSVLIKSSRFVQLYPTTHSLEALEAIETDWTHLTLTFSIKDTKQRHDLLRKAVSNDWSPRELLYEIHSRFTTSRQGKGGRRQKAIRNLDAAGMIRELLRRSEAWTEFFNESFAKASAEQWGKLLEKGDPERSEWIRAQLTSLEDCLKQMNPAILRASSQVQKSLKLLNKATST